MLKTQAEKLQDAVAQGKISWETALKAAAEGARSSRMDLDTGDLWYQYRDESVAHVILQTKTITAHTQMP
jgi:hypothetical protein